MKLKWLFLLGILVSILIRGFFIFNGSGVGDIHALEEMAQLNLDHVNPYLALNYNAYPPLALYIQGVTILIAKATNIPFYILIKFWPNLADLGTSLLIYFYLSRKFSKKSGYIWSLVFFLNPVSILISSAHGQIDSIPTFLTVLSICILQTKSNFRSILLSALCIGLAISIKPSPLMLLPVFIVSSKIELKNKLVFLILAVLPVAIFLKPFVDDYPAEVLKRVFEYVGSADLGLAGLVRGFWFITGHQYSSPFDKMSLTFTKVLFICCLAIFLYVSRKSKNILAGILITYLLFLTTYIGISAQYLGWILPFACLIKDKIVIWYSVFATFTLIGFYMVLNPAIITSRISYLKPPQLQFMPLYIVGNLIVLLITLTWVIKLLKVSTLKSQED